MGASIEQRVAGAAEAALQEHGYVAPVDVLVRMGWLQPVHRDRWQQVRVLYLETVVQASLGKISTAMRALQQWARSPRGLYHHLFGRQKHPLGLRAEEPPPSESPSPTTTVWPRKTPGERE